MMKKINFKEIFTWLDNNILVVLSIFLLAFIPLYPKIPLMNAIEGYIVRIRLEDIFVLITSIIWLIQVKRKKVKFDNPLLRLIYLYTIIAFLSLMSGMFLISTIPLQSLHIAKSFLHFFRYIEYFSLFAILFSSLKNKNHFYYYIASLVVITLAITIYGYGQKYYKWPVYSTMNREFSKGMKLELTEHARIQSTFAGHYDMGAYLVVVLIIIEAFLFTVKKWYLKGLFFVTELAGLWLLIMSASRTSFISYVVGFYLCLLLIGFRKKGLKKKFTWSISRFIIYSFIIFIITKTSGSAIYDRFEIVIKQYPQVYQQYQAVLRFPNQAYETLEEKNDQIMIALGFQPKPKKEKPNDLEAGMLPSDERPVPKKRPDDVYKDIPDKVIVETKSADGQTESIEVEKDRVWSECALNRSLSQCIRIEVLWPNAIQGFKKNPLLGSAYATLNKESKYHFLEADSTDNNYLRILGETGLLGFIAFFSIISVSLFIAYKNFDHDNRYIKAYSIGYACATLGLLVNALYIDVFASSKVAFTYWGLTGILFGLVYIDTDKKDKKRKILNFINQKIEYLWKPINRLLS